MASERFNFWKLKTPPWPREGRCDGLDLVFIPRAFDMVGVSLFDDKWTGIEGYAEPAPHLPEEQQGASIELNNLVESILKQKHPAFKGRRWPLIDRGTIGGLGGLGGFRADFVPAPAYWQPNFHEDDWAVAVQFFKEGAAIREAAIERRRVVVEWLISRVVDERSLRVVLRHVQSGHQIAGPAEHWNGHWYQLEGRWRRGSYYLQAPFAAPGISEIGWQEVAIFFVENDLTALLAGAAGMRPEGLTLDANKKPARRRFTKTKPQLVAEALQAVFPDADWPNEPSRNDKIKAWLKEHRQIVSVSPRSISEGVALFKDGLQSSV